MYVHPVYTNDWKDICYIVINDYIIISQVAKGEFAGSREREGETFNLSYQNFFTYYM